MLCVLAVIIATLGGLSPLVEGQGDELTYTVEEEKPAGTIVGNIAVDSNVSTVVADLTTIRYRILRHNSVPGSYFSIVSTSGILKTAFQLDRENITICDFQPICKFSIYVAMQAGQFFRTILVNIFLEDINDQVPKFPHPYIRLEIPESVNVGFSRPVDSAEDSDGGSDHSIQSYEMIPSNQTFILIVTESLTGGVNLRIKVIAPLNRETTAFYQRVIRAKDGGSDPNTGEMIVNITITDVNDNAPVFSQSGYYSNVSEAINNITAIITLHASDLDAGANGHVYYRLSPHQSPANKLYFKIDFNSGVITAKSSLASLQGETVDLYIEAIDGGVEPLVKSTVVFITVMDTVNDPPAVELSIVSGDTVALVFENATIGFPVAHLIVSDQDSGQNGVVNCSVLSNKFQLQTLKVNEYKVVVSAALDREDRSRYNVSIACQDNGTPPLKTQVSFIVTLLDVNDNTPKFQQSTFLINITENNDIGQEIVHSHASDRDVDENGRITYAIISSYPSITNFININPDTGVITTVDKLDREIFDILNVTIIAFDHGLPPLQANASLTINILDENDNEPEFKEAVYIFHVKENKPIDTHVGTVKAADPDLNGGGFVTYTIVDTGEFAPFILTSTGILLSNDVFDRERAPEYSFDIEARDHGYPSLFNVVRVIVEVDDVNDNHPVLTYPNNVNMTSKISFQSPPGTQVDVAKGKDNDTGINADLMFSMRAGDDDKSSMFSMDGASGIIFVNKHMSENDVGTYVMYISTRDGGSPSFHSREHALEITVFVGNSTAYLSGSVAGQNALIVITLLCLTVVTAAIVLTVLLRIRRRDRQKKTASDVTSSETPRLPPPEYPGVSDAEFANYKPVQCEDSHGGKDNSLNVRKETKQELLLFKMQLAEQYKQRDEDNTQNSCSLSKIQQESCSRSPHLDKYDVTDQQVTRLAALKYHQALSSRTQGKAPHPTIRCGPNGEIITDDILSNSSGETTGGDSGRGYSEEDSHSQGRSSLPSETDDLGIPIVRRDCVRDPNKLLRVSPTKSVLRNSVPVFRQHDGRQLHPSFIDNYPPQNIDPVKLRNTGPRKKPYSVHFDKMSQDNNFTVNVPRNSYMPQPRHYDSNLTFKKGITGFSLDNLNDSVDDDNTTTTSGSYTIDHDELQDDKVAFSHYGIQDVYV